MLHYTTIYPEGIPSGKNRGNSIFIYKKFNQLPHYSPGLSPFLHPIT